ncbi:thiamine-binding protein [Nocardioides sp.]|uniref:thiamine-binding protein n=1 Tax=Nocardioides sp. TaxID=35761 RepID=UPI002C602CCF|nr:thiamine-binding protein [Nocardioides sp.]HSX69148.1 thiamine-binding protein [Nocardioides sp.]
MIVAFSISPSTGDETGGVSEAVAAAVRVVRESGLPHETNAMFTNIEGDWDACMDVVKRAVEAVAAVSPRVSLVLKADVRPGWDGQLAAKVERIEALLGPENPQTPETPGSDANAEGSA